MQAMVVGTLPILTEYIIRRTLLKQLEWLMACRVMVLTGEDIDIEDPTIDDMDVVLPTTTADPIIDGDTTNVS